jgi:hypothetical protein
LRGIAEDEQLLVVRYEDLRASLNGRWQNRRVPGMQANAEYLKDTAELPWWKNPQEGAEKLFRRSGSRVQAGMSTIPTPSRCARPRWAATAITLTMIKWRSWRRW